MIICKICNGSFKNAHAFAVHLKRHNITAKEYYDLYISANNTHICFMVGCDNEVKFLSINSGYAKFCSHSCNGKNNIAIKNPMHIPEIVRKISLSRTGKVGYNKGKTYESLYGNYEAQRLKDMRAKNRLGKSYSEVTLKRMSDSKKGNITSEATRDKLSLAMTGRFVSEATKNKQRLAAIEIVKRKVPAGFHPNYNKNGCLYFENLMLKNNTFIQHAENGGEFFIKELGFWLDGYDKENNIAYEYDEAGKFKSKRVTQKHLNRQKSIEQLLNCSFLRIKEGEYV